MRSEFEFIRNIKEKYGLLKVGDDCAVLPGDSKAELLVTADLLVEDIDFRLGWTKPGHLGHKALAVSLSDIAAMGGTPKWAMLSIGVPEQIWNTTFLDRFYRGWSELAGRFNVELVGGDVSRAADKVVIDSIVMGQAPRGRAITRAGAKPGDSIFVTGSLGGSARGLELLKSGATLSAGDRRLVERHLRPTPRVEIGSRLQRRGSATAMIDISDGLAADLRHVCSESNVGARIYFDLLPVDQDLNTVAQDRICDLVLGGGEDFELLFTSRQKSFSDMNSTRITRIGEITSEPGSIELIVDGKKTQLPRAGYRHF